MGAFDVVPTPLPGCFEVRPTVREDARGAFVKTVHRPEFAAHGLASDFPEQYHSRSHRGVVRGLHFQTPPHDHAKLVYCPRGAVFDAVVDLRRGSPTYGLHHHVELSEENALMLYVPPGFAHGFCALRDDTLMMYLVTSVHAPEHDAGVRWDSAGIPWPVEAPLLSPRDGAFAPLADFESPFVFEPALAEPS